MSKEDLWYDIWISYICKQVTVMIIKNGQDVPRQRKLMLNMEVTKLLSQNEKKWLKQLTWLNVLQNQIRLANGIMAIVMRKCATWMGPNNFNFVYWMALFRIEMWIRKTTSVCRYKHKCRGNILWLVLFWGWDPFDQLLQMWVSG